MLIQSARLYAGGADFPQLKFAQAAAASKIGCKARSPRTTRGGPMSRRRIRDSRILITGASQGIGRALADASAARGARVLAVARSEDLLRELAEQTRARGGTLETFAADITDPGDRQRMAEVAVHHF